MRPPVILPLLVLAISTTRAPAADPVEATRALLAREWGGTIEIELRQLIAQAPPDQAAQVVRTLAKDGPEEAAGILAWTLTLPDPTILASALWAAERRPDVAVERIEDVRALARHHVAQVRRNAARLLGVVMDDRSIPLLIDLLDDPERPVAMAADEALVRMTKRTRGAPSQVWRDWYAKQEALADRLLREQSAELQSDDPDKVTKAMHRLLMLETHGSEVAETVAPLADHPDPNVANLARAALGNLEGPTVERLTERLELQGIDVGERRTGAPAATPSAAAGPAAAATEEEAGGGAWIVIAILAAAAIGLGLLLLPRGGGKGRSSGPGGGGGGSDDDPKLDDRQKRNKKRVTIAG